MVQTPNLALQKQHAPPYDTYRCFSSSWANGMVKNLPSDRNFGYFCIVITLFAAGYAAIKGMISAAVLLLSLSCSFALITIIFPRVLRPINQLWGQLGLALGKIFNPIILGFLYFLLIVPAGIIPKVLGRDELSLKLDNEITSWRPCKKIKLDMLYFKRQF